MKKNDVVFSALYIALSLLSFAFYTINSTSFKFIIILYFLVILSDLIIEVRCFSAGMRRPLLFFTLGIFFWYIYPALINSIDDNYCQWQGVSKCDDISSHYLVCIFISIFVLISKVLFSASTNLFFSSANEKKWGGGHQAFSSKFEFYICLASLFVFIYFVHLSGGISKFIYMIVASRSSSIEWMSNANLGTSTSFVNLILRQFLLASSIVLLANSLEKSKSGLSSRCIQGYSLFVILFLAIASGTRSLFLMSFIPLILVYIDWCEFYKKSWKIKFFIFSALSIIFTQLQLYLRGGLFKSDSFVDTFDYKILTLNNTIDFYSETLFAVQEFNRSLLNINESNILVFLTWPIPRFLWADKPISDVALVYTQERWGQSILNTEGNVFPGIIGQFYMSGLLFSLVEYCLIFIVLAILCKKSLSIISGKYVLGSVAYYLYGMSIFLSFRFFSPGLLLTLIFVLFMVVIYKPVAKTNY